MDNSFVFKGTTYPDDSDAMIAIAQFLVNPTLTDEPMPLQEYLDTAVLDFSIDSLLTINKYLDFVRQNISTLNEEGLQKILIRCGAYCGETIRRNFEHNLYWITNETGVTIAPEIAGFGRSIGYFCFLFDATNGGFIFPLGKVEKYLTNGPEDDLHHFAKGMIAIAKMKRNS